MKTNTSKQWEALWENATDRLRELIYAVAVEENSAVWQSVSTALKDSDIALGPDTKVIEIGAGAGTYSAIFAKQGAPVTVLDYSPKALETSAALFDSLKLEVETIEADALALPENLTGQFNVVMSFGLAEHFYGGNRVKILKSHFDLLKPGGLCVISVPNANCWPYRFWKWRREVFGKWEFGLEEPFSRKEFIKLCKELNQEPLGFSGSPFWSSFNFLLPFARWKKSIQKKKLGDAYFDPERVTMQSSGSLDVHYGYALVLLVRKK